jgi:hypothetical protein
MIFDPKTNGPSMPISRSKKAEKIVFYEKFEGNLVRLSAYAQGNLLTAYKIQKNKIVPIKKLHFSRVAPSNLTFIKMEVVFDFPIERSVFLKK